MEVAVSEMSPIAVNWAGHLKHARNTTGTGTPSDQVFTLIYEQIIINNYKYTHNYIYNITN